MAAWNSSSLGFSDHGLSRHSSGLLKNLTERISKQHLVEHKLFGSKRGSTGKDLKIGKRFRKIGKGIVKSVKPENVKAKGVAPDTIDFDKMMNSVTKKSNSGSKKGFFSRKQFG
jgi:hypothetical protein